MFKVRYLTRSSKFRAQTLIHYLTYGGNLLQYRVEDALILCVNVFNTGVLGIKNGTLGNIGRSWAR